MSEQPTVIRWENPPPTNRVTPGRGSSKYQALADQLRAHPGQWAVVDETRRAGGSALANHIRVGSMLAFTPVGDFEATSRMRQGLATVYARYVGDGAE